MWRPLAVLTANSQTFEVRGGNFSQMGADGGVWLRATAAAALRRWAHGYVGLDVDGEGRTSTPERFYATGEPQILWAATGPSTSISGSVFFIPRRYSRSRLDAPEGPFQMSVLVEIWAVAATLIPEAAPPGFVQGSTRLRPSGPPVGPAGAMRLGADG